MSNLIQKASGVGSATFSNPTQSNTSIIVVYAFNDTSSSLAPTDDKVNSYQFFSGTDSSPNNDGSGSAEIWYLPTSHLVPVTSGVLTVTGHADSGSIPHTAPFIWIYEVITNQTPITDAPTDIECINFGPADTNPNIPTPGFTGTVGQDSTNPNSTGDFCVAICLVGPNGGVVTSVDSPWTLDTILGGNAAAYTFLPNGVDTPVSFHQTSPVVWSISQGCFTADIPVSIPALFKLNPTQPFDEYTPDRAINSTYCTYGFVNSTKATQNPLLGFHRKRFSEIQLNINGSGQETTTLFPNYILKNDLTFNPYAYAIPPIVLQTDPPDDIVRPVNSVGNRVYVMFSTNAVGAKFSLSKTIMVGIIDSYNVVNPNSG